MARRNDGVSRIPVSGSGARAERIRFRLLHCMVGWLLFGLSFGGGTAPGEGGFWFDGSPPGSSVVGSMNTPCAFFASGGDEVRVIQDGGRRYCVHQFTTVGNSTFTVRRSGGLDLEYLIVAGGGGAGTAATNGQSSSAFSRVAMGGRAGGRAGGRGLGVGVAAGSAGGPGAGSTGGRGAEPRGGGMPVHRSGGGPGRGTFGSQDNPGGGGGGEGLATRGTPTNTSRSRTGVEGDRGPGAANGITEEGVCHAGGGAETGHPRMNPPGSAGGLGFSAGGSKVYDGHDGLDRGPPGTDPCGAGGEPGGLLRNAGLQALSVSEGTHPIQVGAGGSGQAQGGSGIVMVRYELLTSLELMGNPAITVVAPALAGTPPSILVEGGDVRLRWASVGTNRVQVRLIDPNAPVPPGLKLLVMLGRGTPMEVVAGGGWVTLLDSTTDMAGDEVLTYIVTLDPVSALLATAPVAVELAYRIHGLSDPCP